MRQDRAEPDPIVGQVLSGRFEITGFIAAGGMGRVYRANQRALDRDVAIKIMDHGGRNAEEFQRRFYLEASLCARLSHPSIVRIFDYGCHEDSLFFIVMELLAGRTLGQLCEESGPISPRRAVGFVKQICGALVEAHAADLVHRDIKPSNLFVVTDKLGEEHVKILDFGVVKQVRSSQTTQNGTMGSPHYISPEQIDDCDVDARSDLYSLGVVLYQLLTGQLPFASSDLTQLMMDHKTSSPPPFAEANPHLRIPEALEQVTMRALAKDAEDRFGSARAMRRALVELEGDLPEEEPRDLEPGPAPLNVHPTLLSEVTKRLTVAGAPEVIMPPVIMPPVMPQPTIRLDTGSIAEMKEVALDGFVAYVDFNCPYCFALHERVCRWGLADRVEWCVIEHSSHILDGPFGLDHEQMLSAEVVEVHHRAPDVELKLPHHRCRSTTATRLQAYVQREMQDKQHEFRSALFRALWQNDADIGERSVLEKLLASHDIPDMFLEFCDEEPPELTEWQRAWETAPFDFSIPVITHPETDRVLIGLPDERTLKRFFLGEGVRVLDSGVCYYQQRPTILIAGWMSHIWPILSDVRGACEVLQAPTAENARTLLSELAVPDLLVIEAGHVPAEDIDALATLARARCVPWAVATRTPSSAEEMWVLSLGAIEYLPATGDAQVARARLGRILQDRYRLDRRDRQIHVDTLTGLPTRQTLLESLRSEWERNRRTGTPISFVLLDLDRFKPFNKSHGYLAGNEVLQQLAQSFRTEVRAAGSVVSRFSGNEFAALLPGVSAEDAQAIAQRLQGIVAEAAIEHRGADDALLTASVGVSTLLPTDQISLHHLVDEATAALRKSRRAAARYQAR